MRLAAVCLAVLAASAEAAPIPAPRPTVWYADLQTLDGVPTFTITKEGQPSLLIICKPNEPAGVMYKPIRGLDGVDGLTPVGYVLSDNPGTPHVGIWFARNGVVIPYDRDIAPTLIRHLMRVPKVAFFITRDHGAIDHGWIFDVSGIAAHRNAINRHCFRRP